MISIIIIGIILTLIVIGIYYFKEHYYKGEFLKYSRRQFIKMSERVDSINVFDRDILKLLTIHHDLIYRIDEYNIDISELYTLYSDFNEEQIKFDFHEKFIEEDDLKGNLKYIYELFAEFSIYVKFVLHSSEHTIPFGHEVFSKFKHLHDIMSRNKTIIEKLYNKKTNFYEKLTRNLVIDNGDIVLDLSKYIDYRYLRFSLVSPFKRYYYHLRYDHTIYHLNTFGELYYERSDAK